VDGCDREERQRLFVGVSDGRQEAKVVMPMRFSDGVREVDG
jgi:hypothetical protein